MSDTPPDDRPRMPYGTWPSAVDLDEVSQATLQLGDVKIDDGRAVWAETRPAEEGRTVVVAHDGTRVRDLLDEDADVRSRVHEYGGGSWIVRDAVVWACDHDSQRIIRHVPDASAKPVTPAPDASGSVRYGDLHLSADGRSLLAVRERSAGDGDEVHREIVSVPVDGKGEQRVVAAGHDFFASPRLSADGRRLAYVTWEHPDMPWDAAQLWVADVDADGEIGGHRVVAGGPGRAVTQPVWGSDGSLWFVDDPDGWWHLHRLTPRGDVEAVTRGEQEYAWPLWQLGMASYAPLPDGRVVAVANAGGVQHVELVAPDGSTQRLPLPFTAIAPRIATDGRTLLLVAGSGSLPSAVVRVDLESRQHTTLRRSSELRLDAADLSLPQALEVPTRGGLTTHAFWYPPRSSRAQGSEGERPPLVLMVHGGPTSQSVAVLRPYVQVFTSRGFAVVDVNYGGSTGYGRAYRERLRGAWGRVDVEDCTAVARFLADTGQVDGARMAITGASAGGFTALAALTSSDVFACGTSWFGVADLELLAEHTHDFESRYLDGLVGPLPQTRDVWRARSPIHHVQRLSSPVLLLQGDEDQVVPLEQAEQMAASCAERGIPHVLLRFAGERHGFRRADSIRRALEAELGFYGAVFGFTPDGVEPLELTTRGPDPGDG